MASISDEPLVFEKQEVRHLLIMHMPLYSSTELDTLPDADILSKSGSHGLSRANTSTTSAWFQVVVSVDNFVAQFDIANI